MSATFQVDADTEKILVNDRWLSRTELSEFLIERLASMDYNVALLTSAVEYLDKTMSSMETFSVRLNPEMAAHLRESAEHSGQSAGAIIRHALAAYLMSNSGEKL